MKAYSILEFKLDHLDDVLELIRLNTPKYFAVHEEQELRHYLENNIEHYYVYLLDGKIIGCAGINFSEDYKEAFMSWGMVHPEYQGQGFGKKMTQHRVDVLENYPDLEKITLKTSQKTFEFYEKLNFRVIRTEKDFWADGLDLVLMEYHFTNNQS